MSDDTRSVHFTRRSREEVEARLLAQVAKWRVRAEGAGVLYEAACQERDEKARELAELESEVRRRVEFWPKGLWCRSCQEYSVGPEQEYPAHARALRRGES